MATDAEESDTDERPTKRLRLGNNDRLRMQDQRRDENIGENLTREEEESNEIERRTRERLKKWQARQVAKGFVDNTINRVLENYVVAPSFGEMHSPENNRANDMEDRAVSMAIINHGLVQPANFILNPDPPRSPINDYWIGEEEVQVRCTCPLGAEQNGLENVAGSAASSDQAFGRSEQDEGHACWVGDKGDENNQQQDFLERAVAEAIKKKGLSALSVDYG